MKRAEKIGIAATALLAPGYVALMKATDQPIEWFVVGFIVAVGVFLVLNATVFRRHLEDTPENREKFKKVIVKAARGALRKGP